MFMPSPTRWVVRWLYITILAMALSVSMMLGCVGQARAGTNGQHLAFTASCDANWAYIRGYNQQNVYTEQWFEVPADVPEQGWCGTSWYDWGYWWKGSVRVDAYWTRNGENYAGTRYVSVPIDQGVNDWTWVQMP